MAAPTLTAVTDRAAYAPGDRITLTVSYADADTKPSTITITGTDQAGQAATVTVRVGVVDPVTLTVSDDGGRVWARGADTGAVAVFTSTA